MKWLICILRFYTRVVVQVFKYRWGDQNLTSQKLGTLTRVVQGKQGREMGALNLTSPTACAPSP